MNEKKEIKRESGVRTIRSILIREPDVYFIRSCNTVVQLSKIIAYVSIYRNEKSSKHKSFYSGPFDACVAINPVKRTIFNCIYTYATIV